MVAMILKLDVNCPHLLLFCLSQEATKISTKSVDNQIVNVSVSKALMLCTKVCLLLIQYFSDRNWIGGAKFDESLTYPKNRAQIEKALGISNNLYWTGSEAYGPYFLRMGQIDPSWIEPPRKE